LAQLKDIKTNISNEELARAKGRLKADNWNAFQSRTGLFQYVSAQTLRGEIIAFFMKYEINNNSQMEELMNWKNQKSL
jgi:hypothetical protein